MAIRIGISPIAWQNDDLPEMTAAFTMDDALRDAAAIGYCGVERGRRMPADTEGLQAYLDRHGLALCGGWCSGALMTRSVAEEIESVRAQVAQFVALGAPCLVYAECSNTVQGDRGVPMGRRPKLGSDEIAAYAAKLSELAKWMADEGMALSYHHHMGSMIEDAEDVDRLMAGSSAEVNLLYDTGHLAFGGADPLAVLDRWGDRVNPVHVKDVRPEVTARARTEGMSFLDAVAAGAFTVPGDGALDFESVARRLAAMDYDGWIVVEAEQDPAKAPPLEYSRMGYEHILAVCAAAGLAVESPTKRKAI